MYLFNATGKKFRQGDIQWVDHVTKLKKKSGSNPWPVIEECFNFWANHRPTHYRSFIISIQDIKETLRDSKFATTPEERYRRKLDFPEEVMMMIRCVYSEDELPMDREFFTSFWNRFPKFRISDKQ